MDQLIVGWTNETASNQVAGTVLDRNGGTRSVRDQSKEEEDDGDETIERFHIDERRLSVVFTV
jgi:hypothetical protein